MPSSPIWWPSPSSNKVLTYANGDNTMYMDHSFLCALKPGGNAEPFVGDEESLSVGWFDLDDLPTPLAASTSERLELFHTYIETKNTATPTPCSSSMGSSTSGYKVSSL